MFKHVLKRSRAGAWMLASMMGAAALPWHVQAVEAESVVVRMTDFVNDNGRVQCGLFDREDGWRDESRALKMTTARIEGKRATCRFEQVDPGQYAVAVFHAQANESQVNYGLFGKPQQGVGFSNNPSVTWGPPSFDEAAFRIESATVNLDVQMKY